MQSELDRNSKYRQDILARLQGQKQEYERDPSAVSVRVYGSSLATCLLL